MGAAVGQESSVISGICISFHFKNRTELKIASVGRFPKDAIPIEMSSMQINYKLASGD